MDKTDRLRDYGLAFLLYEQSLGICGYELIRELFIFIKLILNSYLVRELYEERKCLTNLLIDQAEKWSASDLREKAIAMIGEKEYLRRKIAKGYNLWDADKKLLDEILRK